MLSIFKGNDDTSQVIANKESMSETNVIIIIWKHLRRRRFSVPPSHSSLQRCSSESLSLAPKHMLATKISLSEQWIGYNEMLQSLEKWFNESIQKQKCCTMYTQDTNTLDCSQLEGETVKLVGYTMYQRLNALLVCFMFSLPGSGWIIWSAHMGCDMNWWGWLPW